jgi:hypothetical protein
MAGKITDVSGRAIPSDYGRSQGAPDIPRVLAQAPVYNQPDAASQEFLFVGIGQFPASTLVFTAMTDGVNGGVFAPQIDKQYKARMSTLFITCPDMVTDVTPYLTVRLTVNGQAAPAWGTVPLAPRNGIASLSFDTQLLLQPNAILGLLVQNNDVTNGHFVMVYLYGWQWPV